MICYSVGFLLSLLVVFANEDVVKQKRKEFIRTRIGDILEHVYDACDIADCESELNACRQAATQRAVRIDFHDESFVFVTGTPQTSFAELMDEVKAQFNIDVLGLRFVYTLDGYQFEVWNDKTLSAAWAVAKELNILLRVKTLRLPTSAPTNVPTATPTYACNLKPENTNRMLVLTSASVSLPVAYEYVKVLKTFKVAVDVSNTWTKGVPLSSGCSAYGTISICLKSHLPPATSSDIRARLENFMKMGGRIMMCSGASDYGQATVNALQKTSSQFVYDLLAKGWKHINSNDHATSTRPTYGRASYWAKGYSSIPAEIDSDGDYICPTEDIMYKSPGGGTSNVASVAKHTVGKGGIIWYADRLFDERGFQSQQLRKAVYLGVTGGQGNFFD